MSGDESKPDEQAQEHTIDAADAAVEMMTEVELHEVVEEQTASAEVDGEVTDLNADEVHERELESLRLQLQQREDALLRLQAEMDNLRKRGQRDLENAHKFGVEKLIAALLPIKDSMELGLASAQDTDAAAIREGITLTDKMLASTLEKFGVELVDPSGSAFDPERHQAMTMQEVEGVEAGQVVTVFQKGYVLNGRLVRPAMVIVSK